MQYNQAAYFLFDGMSILEWHDGVVRAIGTQQGTSFLITLVAWDIANNRKAYVITETDPEWANSMNSLISFSNDRSDKYKRWADFNHMFETYIDSYQGPVYLTFEDPAVGNRLSTKSICPMCLQKLKEYNLEETMSSELISYWFEMKY